jgi:hypothetical protein
MQEWVESRRKLPGLCAIDCTRRGGRWEAKNPCFQCAPSDDFHRQTTLYLRKRYPLLDTWPQLKQVADHVVSVRTPCEKSSKGLPGAPVLFRLLSWSDGKPIEGIAVAPAESDGASPTFELDYNLSPPENPNQAADPGYLALVHQQWGFLPNLPEMISQAALNEIDACHAFAEIQIEACNFYFEEALENDLIAALACICFRDPFLKEAAVSLDMDNVEAIKRFGSALAAVIAASSK